MSDPLQALEALVQQATPGPWVVTTGSWDEDGSAQYALDGITHVTAHDARLIALAPTLAREALALARLCETVEEVWEPLTGACAPDCDCVVHDLRAALDSFKAALSEEAGK